MLKFKGEDDEMAPTKYVVEPLQAESAFDVVTVAYGTE